MVTYEAICKVCQVDFDQMDRQVFGSLDSKVQLIMSVSSHVIGAGGKRMRPLVALLCARMLSDESHDDIIKIAATTEMLHTATLVHDDVVDKSTLRRGRPTANATWDNATAVLVGDYLIARAFDLLVEFGNLELLSLYSKGTCHIAEGEVRQLTHQHDIQTQVADYLAIVDGKTARLFMMAAQGVCLLLGQTKYLDALGIFGKWFGRAFQMIDDVLDYQGAPETMGKNLGDDLAEGKPTLPVIYALQSLKGTCDYQALADALQTGKAEDVGALSALVLSTDAIDKTRRDAKHALNEAQMALISLPDNRYKEALLGLIELGYNRLA